MNHDLRCFYGDSISAQQLMIVATLTVLICGSTRAAFAQSDSERNRELGRKLERSQQIIEEMAARIQKLEMSDSPPRASDPSAPSKVAAVTKLSARETGHAHDAPPALGDSDIIISLLDPAQC